METKTKFIRWWPENPIQLRPLGEMIIFTLIVAWCGFYFYRWNVIPHKKIKVRIENLGNGTAGAKCHFAIPMTSIEDCLSFEKTSLKVDYSVEGESQFLKMSTYMDSVKQCVLDSTPINEKHYELCRNICADNGVEEEFNLIYGKNVEEYKMKLKEIDSLRMILKNANVRSLFMNFLELKLSNPNIVKQKIKKTNYNKISNDTIDSIKAKVPFAKLLLARDTIILNPVNDENFIGVTFLRSGAFAIGELDNLKFEGAWYNSLNPFASSVNLDRPTWQQMEDISQAYMDLELTSLTIDSINLKLDFVGATEFSYMEPMPDKISMSSIEFYDPEKIMKIRANGLRFHAKFKELENWQQVRVFAVTAIISGFVTIFIVFILYSILKFKRKYIIKKKK